MSPAAHRGQDGPDGIQHSRRQALGLQRSKGVALVNAAAHRSWICPAQEDTAQTVSPTGAPLYKVAPVTKIRVEPSKALKSPFLVKRQSLRRPDTKILQRLYHDITTNPPPIWQERFKDLPELVKIEETMNAEQIMINWLNIVVSNMRREDARDFWNTKCLGWRHYVDPKWAETSMSGNLNPKDLKKLFYGGSVLYNASQSHMVFIPVFQDHQWTLYAFNMCDQKLSILDSRPDTTKGVDPTKRHRKTRCNICDALTVTMNFAIDFRSWEYQFPKVPRQQDSCSSDSGFFVFNFMRLWDGYQLVRWFPSESMELRKDFLAYIVLCKDNNEHLPGNHGHLHDNNEHPPDEVSSMINNLPGMMMDCTVQNVASGIVAIEIGPDVEAPDPASSDFLEKCHRVTSDGDGVFHIAARFNNDKIVSQMNTRDREVAGALLAAVNDRGDTTLHCAAAGGRDVMVNYILHDMMPQNINQVTMAKFLRAQNLKGETCLHEAVRHGNVNIVKELVKKDLELAGLKLVQIVDNEGISPLYLATTLRKTKILEVLVVEAASAAGPAGKTALHAAVVLLDKGLVETLLNWNPGLTTQVDESGSTPLHFLASLSLQRREPNSIVQYLYKVPHFFNYLRKCLHCKPAQDSSIVKLIMGKNQDSALHADSSGSVPIHIAAAHGRLDIVTKLLTECPYCESSRNASGQTFLHVAVEKEKLDIVESVCGAKKFNKILNAEDQDGNTALHLAVIKASENAVNTASEKIFCTLMSTTDVGLSFANKEGYTPLDLAFLSLHPEVICMKGPREWIYFDLLHGGGEFGVGGWDRLAGNLVEPDWEKESERVGKSASMLALSVLILNASFLVPFSVLNRMDKWGVDLDQLQGSRAILFQTFVVFDSIAFACSVMATYFCACAGFAMLDGLTRLKNLMSGTFYVIMAAPALIVAVALALYLVLPSMSFALPIILAGFGILLRFLYGFFKSKITSIRAHLSAVQARVGFPKLARILFQRSAIKPLWVVPSASTRLFWLAAALFSVYFIPTSVVQVFQQNNSV